MKVHSKMNNLFNKMMYLNKVYILILINELKFAGKSSSSFGSDHRGTFDRLVRSIFFLLIFDNEVVTFDKSTGLYAYGTGLRREGSFGVIFDLQAASSGRNHRSNEANLFLRFFIINDRRLNRA